MQLTILVLSALFGPCSAALATDPPAPVPQPAWRTGRHFIPKFSPLPWYSSPELLAKGGALPDRPSFAIAGETAKSFVIKLKDGKSSDVHVAREHGLVAPTGKKASFSEHIALSDRPPLRFWRTEDSVTTFLTDDVSDSVLNSVEEFRLDGWRPASPLPVLAEKRLTLKIGAEGSKAVRIVETILRLPRAAEVRALQVANVEAVRRILFLIDAGGSMVPEGRRVLLAILSQMADGKSTWRKNKVYSSMFFWEAESRDQLRLNPFRSFGEAARIVEQRAGQFGGGGADEKPLLDALSFATDRFPWGPPAKGSDKGERTILALVSVDMRTEVKGSPAYETPAAFDAKRLVEHLGKNRLNLVIVQCSPEPGPQLAAFLSRLEADKLESVRVIRYGKSVVALAVNALAGIVASTKIEQAAEANAKRLAQHIASLGGVPVYPRRFNFEDLASEIEKGAPSAPEDAAWVQIPVWMVADELLVE